MSLKPLSRQRFARHGSIGFTLVELTVVLFIISLLIAGMMGPVAVQMEARDRRSTQVAMEEAVEALYGFALTNGRLPCPDANGDGFSDSDAGVFNPTNSATAVCATNNGLLPWAELGAGRGDAWGNRFTYRVRHPDFTWPAQDTTCNGHTAHEFDLCTVGNIEVRTRGDLVSGGLVQGKKEFPAATAEHVVAVIVSHGRNGYGAMSVDGVSRPSVPAEQADEAENDDNNLTFFSRNYTSEQDGCADDENEATPLCAFDDIVMTVSRTILNSRMVAAGRLP
jgi:type II secretory pathway pseudopilin PulG